MTNPENQAFFDAARGRELGPAVATEQRCTQRTGGADEVGLVGRGAALGAVGATLEWPGLFVASFLLAPLGVALLVWSVTQRWICPSCGHGWAERARSEDDLDEEDEEEHAEEHEDLAEEE